MKPPPTPMMAASVPTRSPTPNGGMAPDVEVRGTKAHLQRQAVHPVVAPTRCPLLAAPRFGHRGDALDEHQHADCAEEDDVAERHEQIDLADGAQRGEDLDADRRADEATQQQDETHLEVDRAPAPMRQHAREGRGDDLVRLGRHGHRRRDADEDQERGHQKAAADAEDAREKADPAAESEQKQGVHRHFCDRQVDVHQPVPGPRLRVQERDGGFQRDGRVGAVKYRAAIG